jgi:hypothetical protein
MSTRQSEIDSVLREAFAGTKTLDEFEAALQLIRLRPEWRSVEFVELVNQRIYELAKERLDATSL